MNTLRWYVGIALTVLLVVGVGLFVVESLTKRVDQQQRSQLLQEAQQAALLIRSDAIASLSASPTDLQDPTYQSIKDALSTFRSYNASLRFVYVLGYKPEIKTQFFYVDSELVGSPDYSPPGQLFPNTRQQDIDQYLTGEPYTDGPYQDQWGEWVSGYAPIKTSDGEVVALLGIDTATSVWKEQIGFIRTVGILIVALFSVILIWIGSFFVRKQRWIEHLQKENTTLVHNEHKAKELQSIAHIGRMQIYFPEQVCSFDEQFLQILSLSPGSKISLGILKEVVHPDDQEKIKKMIGEILQTTVLYTWTDIRMGSLESGFRMYHIYGNIERDPSLAPIRFSGIIQDITDIHTT